MKTKYIIYTMAIGLLALFNACSSANKKDETAKPAMMMPMNMETIKLQKMNPSVQVRIPGELIADQEVEIYAKVSSYAKTLRVDVGSQVKQGDVLMTLEAPEINSQLASALSKLKAQEAIYIATKATYERVLRANETEGAVARDAVDQITAKKLADEAQLEAARSAYNEVKSIENYLVIRAPFNGVVTQRSVDVGAYVGPAGKGSQMPLLVVQKDSELRLILAVPEAHTPYVQKGDTVTFVAKAIPQTIFSGKVIRKSGALDTKLRAEQVEVDINNKDKQLLPRMVVDATLSLKAKEASFFVPKSAVVDSNMGIYVMQIVDGKTKKTSVRKGRNHGMMVEIFGNLEEGNTLLKVVGEETKEGMEMKGE